jgi:hypothetical protein
VALTPLELDPDEGATGTLTYTVRAHDLPRPITNTAYVTGTAVSLFLTATAQTAAAVAVVNPAAMVVNKTPSGTTAEVGQTITYTYRVTNTGTVTLVNVTGRDDRLGVVTFSLTALRPEENTIATLAHTVNVDDWPGPVTNTVHVTGTGDVGVPLTTTAQAIASVELTGPAAISVGKTVDTRTARLGQTITYSYRVTNTGTVTLSDVAGRDDKLGVLPFDITTLGPDESFTATLSYQVRATDLPGPLTNTVEVSGTAAAGLPLTAMAQDVATVFFETVYVPVVLKLVP